MSQINYEKLAGAAPPYIPPYETLNYEIDCSGTGVITERLKIDTSGGTIGTTFTTVAPGLYAATVLIPSGTPVIGLSISNPVRSGSGDVLVTNIRDNGSGTFAFTVQDPNTSIFLDNWFFLQITIFVKTT
jgi:hypothetical protein